MGRPVRGDIPIGLAGIATAGRLSGGGTATATRFLVGLGDGVALGDGLRLGDAVGPEVGSALADGDTAALDDVEGTAATVGDCATDGTVVGSSVGSAVGRATADEDDATGADDEESDGDPDGLAVQATKAPAQARAPTSSNGRLTRTGYDGDYGPTGNGSSIGTAIVSYPLPSGVAICVRHSMDPANGA